MNKVVFVGQTPPPYHGQAIMIEKILAGQYNNVKLYHVRMAFSGEIDEIGKINIGKVFHLLIVICRIAYLRFGKSAKVLYYPPAGPGTTPIVRDLVILICTRWLFQRTIFHFHAGGLSEVRFKSSLLRRLFEFAYHNADCAILLSEFNPHDGTRLKARQQVVIPYGIEDYAATFEGTKIASKSISILFVGMVKESKGVLVLLEAARRLRSKNFDVVFNIVGKFESSEFEHTVKNIVSENNLETCVNFLGVLTGHEKFQAFKNADIFCFPTFFESETFGVVLLEAMQFSLPVVATRWRGIPSIVVDGENGFLTEPKDATQVAQSLAKLAVDPLLRRNMGAQGRKKFLENYTLQKFINRMEGVFSNC